MKQMERLTIEFARSGHSTVYLNAWAPKAMTEQQLENWLRVNRDYIIRLSRLPLPPCLLVLPTGQLVRG